MGIRKTKDLLKASYQSQKDADATLAKYGLKRDEKLSKMDTKVYYNEHNRKPVIIHRGSTTLKDWRDDALLGLGLGKIIPRYNNSVKLNDEIKTKYGRYANSVGHSYGGWLSENTGKARITTYNKAVGIGDVLKTIPKNQTDIITRTDLVSAPSRLQKHKNPIIYLNQKKYSLNPIKSVLNAHNLDNLV
jgi:hypothetical protein